MKRPSVLSHWAEAAGFILAVWTISFLLLYHKKLKTELASVQLLISRFEAEAEFFQSMVEPTQLATGRCMREIHTLKSKLDSTRESLADVKVDGKKRIEKTKKQHLEWEKQVSKDFDRLTEDVSLCEEWTVLLKKNQSALLIMAKKQSVITCVMELTGLKGELADTMTQINRLEKNNKNFQVLTKQWRGRVASSKKELDKLEQQISELRAQLHQQGCK